MSVSSPAPSSRVTQDLSGLERATLASQAPVLLEGDLLSVSPRQPDAEGKSEIAALTDRLAQPKSSALATRTLAHLSTRTTLDHDLVDAIMSEGYDAIGDSLAWDQISLNIAKIFGGEQVFFLTKSGEQATGYKVIGSSLNTPQRVPAYLEEVRCFEQQRTRPTDRPSPFLAFPYLERLSTFSFEVDKPCLDSRATKEKASAGSAKKRHCLFPLANQDEGGLFILIRPLAKGDLSTSELDLLQHVLPHLSRAVALHEQTSQLTQKNLLLEELLDSLPQGLALTDSDGQLIYANSCAQAHFEERDGLTKTNGQLCATNQQDGKLIKQKLEAATIEDDQDGAADQEDTARDCSALLPRRQDDSHLALTLTSMAARPIHNSGLKANNTWVRWLLRDSRDQKQPSPESLKRAFNLTPTEAAVALLLGQGKSAEEVALLRSITKETARFYIKAILQKMDCHRQPQLVHKLATLGL